MLRNLENGDKVIIRPFITYLGEQYVGKVTKIGTAYIYVKLMKIGDVPVAIPRILQFNKNTFIGVGKDKMYEIDGVMFGEHEKYN